MTSFLIQRLSLIRNHNQDDTLFVTSICMNPESKKYTPLFVSPTHATNEHFIKVAHNDKFSLGIKKKYASYDFKIILDEESQKYELHYNKMPTYILASESEQTTYSLDDEFHFISTENNTFFEHPITNFVPVQEEVKPKKRSPRVKKSDSSPTLQKEEVTVEESKEEEVPMEESKEEEVPMEESKEEEVPMEESKEEEVTMEEFKEEEVTVEESKEEVPMEESKEEEVPMEESKEEEVTVEETIFKEEMVAEEDEFDPNIEDIEANDVGKDTSSIPKVTPIIPLPFVYQNKIYQTNVSILTSSNEKNLLKLMNEEIPINNFIFQENKKSLCGLMIEEQKSYVVNIQHTPYLFICGKDSTLLVQNMNSKKYENVTVGNQITLSNITYGLCAMNQQKISSPLLLVPLQSMKIFDNKYGFQRTVYTPKINVEKIVV